MYRNGIFPPITKVIIKEEPKDNDYPKDIPKKQAMYLTTTLPRRSESKLHPVQIYNGHKFVDRRNDKPSGIDLYAWQLKANAQPLYKQLQQARKVLTTHDWMVKSIFFFIEKSDGNN